MYSETYYFKRLLWSQIGVLFRNNHDNRVRTELPPHPCTHSIAISYILKQTIQFK